MALGIKFLDHAFDPATGLHFVCNVNDEDGELAIFVRHKDGDLKDMIPLADIENVDTRHIEEVANEWLAEHRS